MKLIAINIIKAYLGIGLLFAFILEFSWTWSLFVTLFTEVDAWFSIAGLISLSMSILFNLILEPLLRTLFWLPSLLSLLSPDVSTGFMQWAFPGFYDTLISTGE